ncbi:WxL domain-containing protein [Latilactobacillus curvatus]|uniref:WxL domain-containing protein n=1 Tax=Latilactobacillus curvatus TaxID=28038 RepID=UPI002410FF29|nr:WxL domain-containing protein [Latilactobacillus curvatus]MDG2979268.1 WxL domain-containing protein [Latilactobacillus curvatus]
MKKIMISTLLFSGMLSISTGQVHAADADSHDTIGNVGFTAPTTGGSTMTNTDALNIDFGSNPISADDKTYTNINNAKATVQDIRGTAAGWTLTVAQNAQFKTSDNDELTGAQITIKTPTLDSNSTATATVDQNLILTTDNTAHKVMGAAAGDGNGTAIADMNTGSVALAVPGKTVKVAKNYTTMLTWNLADAPANN